MAKREIILSDEQKKRNQEILDRLAEERQRLVEETRSLQKQSRGRKKRDKKPI